MKNVNLHQLIKIWYFNKFSKKSINFKNKENSKNNSYINESFIIVRTKYFDNLLKNKKNNKNWKIKKKWKNKKWKKIEKKIYKNKKWIIKKVKKMKVKKKWKK